jgi:hypothetical protein
MSTYKQRTKNPGLIHCKNLFASEHLSQLNKQARFLEEINLFLHQQSSVIVPKDCCLSALNNDQAILTAPDAIKATKLRYQQQQLLKVFAQHPKLKAINKIIFRVQPHRPYHEPPPAPPMQPMPEKAKQLVAQLAQKITHQPLKQALLKLSQTQTSAKK